MDISFYCQPLGIISTQQNPNINRRETNVKVLLISRVQSANANHAEMLPLVKCNTDE